jgi:hypothetical protein
MEVLHGFGASWKYSTYAHAAVDAALSVHSKEEAMHEGPRLKETQLKHLRDLLAKRGWDEDTFARTARTPLEALNPSQAREWITKLTKATKGKPRATPRSTTDVAPEAELEGAEDAE